MSDWQVYTLKYTVGMHSTNEMQTANIPASCAQSAKDALFREEPTAIVHEIRVRASAHAK